MPHRTLPFFSRLYIVSISTAGLAVLILSVNRTAQIGDLTWTFLVLVTWLASLFPLYLPSLKGSNRGAFLTLGTVFIFTAILVYGPEVAAVVATVEALISSWRSRRALRSPYKLFFNVLHLPLVTYIVGWTFYLLYESPIPLDPEAPQGLLFLFLLASVCSIFYFLLNSGAVALGIALVTRQSLSATWQERFLPTALTNISEACVAVFFFLNLHQMSLFVLGVAVPTALVIYYAYRMNLVRVAQAQSHAEQVNKLYHSTVEALAMAVDAKDQRTHGHVNRVPEITLVVAKACGIVDEGELEGLKAASVLHDIGKLASPDHILNKPSSLTDSEMEIMRAHASVGADVLSSVPFPYPVVPFVRHHHEKWDGTGYPDGLKGDEIPMGARILAIVDCYDALISDRPFRPRLKREAALDYIRSEAGKSYDPVVVEQFLKQIDGIEMSIESQEVSESENRARKFAKPKHSVAPKKLSGTVFHDIASAQKEVQAIHEVSQAVGRLLSVSETMALLAERIQNVVHYDACCFFLIDSNNESLMPYYAVGDHSDRLSRLNLKVGRGVVGWVAANSRSVLNVSPAVDFLVQTELQEVFKSCLAIPLKREENVVGVVNLYLRKESGFLQNQLRVMESIASPVATAIGRAIVFEETEEKAYTDQMTGLPNLRYLKIVANQQLQQFETMGSSLSLIMMDVDAFKSINDRFGHPIGDEALAEIADALKDEMRKDDTCARYGGDEFVTLHPGLGRTEAQDMAKRIQKAVSRRKVSIGNGQSVRLEISVGVANFPDDGRDFETLVDRADQAMYQNKLSRKKRRAAGSSPVIEFHKKTS